MIANTMLIHLKKIRNKLITEGKLMRYLAYAIGEILLVVAGILIALQVNQWNLEKNQRALEQRYYQSIKTQLAYDKEDLQGNIRYGNSYLSQYQQADRIIASQDKTQMDTVGEIALNLFAYSDFRQKSTVYKTLVNTGDVKYIRNYAILEQIEELETDYIYIERLEETHANAVLDIAVPSVSAVLQISPFSVKDTDSLYAYPFHNNFLLFIELIEEKNGVYQDAINKIDIIIKAVDEELEGFE